MRLRTAPTRPTRPYGTDVPFGSPRWFCRAHTVSFVGKVSFTLEPEGPFVFSTTQEFDHEQHHERLQTGFQSLKTEYHRVRLVSVALFVSFTPRQQHAAAHDDEDVEVFLYTFGPAARLLSERVNADRRGRGRERRPITSNDMLHLIATMHEVAQHVNGGCSMEVAYARLYAQDARCSRPNPPPAWSLSSMLMPLDEVQELYVPVAGGVTL